MSSILSSVSESLYNRLSQCAPSQIVAFGKEVFSQGESLFYESDLDSNAYLMGKRISKIIASCLILGGLASVLLGNRTSHLEENRPVSDLYQKIFEKEFKQSPEQDIPEILYLGASHDSDPYRFLAPPPHGPNSLPVCLHKIKNTRHRVVAEPMQICKEIKWASERGAPIEGLVIGAHGNPNLIQLGKTSTSRFKLFDQLPDNCFDGLSPDARIFIMSCSAGADSYWMPNIAEWLSWISRRQVIAPSENIFMGECSINPNNKQLEIRFLHHTDATDYSRFVVGDCTRSFDTTSTWTKQALFSLKMIAPSILGAMVALLVIRIGATILEKSGSAIQWIGNKGSRFC